MCFSQKKPEIPPPPPPAPTPISGDVQPEKTAEQKRSKIAALRYGAMSTIKTGGQGLAGTGSNLQAAAGMAGQNKTLGA